MKIVYDALRPVKSARPFAAGILPPDPITAAERNQIDAADAEWITANGGPSHPWELEVRSLLRSLAYPPVNVAEIVSWIGSQGRVDGCPVIDPEDVSLVNAIVARHLADLVARDATGGDIESDPAHWPAWTDYHRFHPTPEESAWWTAESERLESARLDHHYDLQAHESAALDALTRGLIPPDLASHIARTSLVGHHD